MAGSAITNDFLLGTATVMVGAQDDIFNLNPAAHSIGLVKNFTITADPQYTELTQGVKNTIVDSALTQNPVRCKMETYEATAKNIMYGLGLDGSTLTSTGLKYTPAANIAAAATTLTIATDVHTTFLSGDWIAIKEGDDKVHIAKLSTNSAYSDPNTTLTFTGYAVPSGVTFTAASTKVFKVALFAAGSKLDQPYLSAKIVGVLSNNDIVTLLVPKLRVVNGFSLAFTTDQYGNLPFEFTPYELVSSDTHYAKWPNGGTVQMYKGVA